MDKGSAIDEYFELYGFPLFCFDIREYWKDWKMSDKRSYKDILASVETHFIYINNHLSNIDQHLEKINTTNLDQEVKIIRNKDRIGLIYKILGGMLIVFGGGGITKLLELW